MATAVRTRKPGRAVLLLLSLIYFVLPIYASLQFSLENVQGGFTWSAIRAIPSQPGLAGSVWLSTRIGIVTMIILMLLVVPTVIYVHLRLPGMKRTMEIITLLPIVIPPIVLILGVLDATPLGLKASPYLLSLVYVVLALPFVYRSLAAGLDALDLRTLEEAAKSLGSGALRTIRFVILPNLRSSLLSAVVLSLALVLGEFTMASLDLWQTLPVWIVNFSGSDPHISTAVAMLSLLGTWALLALVVFLDRSHSRRLRKGLVQ